MTYGIPLTSFNEKQSPSLDNATWFNHSAFVFVPKPNAANERVRKFQSDLDARVIEARENAISPSKRKRLMRREKAELAKAYLRAQK